MNNVNSTNSILTSIKKLLGLVEEDTSFDLDVIIHINTVFAGLNQLGVGPSNVYQITDKNNLWSEFNTESDGMLNAVKTYMYLKVRMLFDPPTNGAVREAFEKNIHEYEWRLFMNAETQDKE